MRKPRASIEEGESAIKVRNALYEPWEKAQTKKKEKTERRKESFNSRTQKWKKLLVMPDKLEEHNLPEDNQHNQPKLQKHFCSLK